MDDQSQRAEQVRLLQRLDNSELVVLNERWAGRTSAEIATALGISLTAARNHLGNIYDKLGVTYVEGTSSLARIMDFYNASGEPGAPHIPTPSSLYQDELATPSQPSAQALELVQNDDDALVGQRPIRALDDEYGPTRPVWIWIAAAFAGLLVLALLLFFLFNDDGDDEDQAQSETATAFTQDLDGTATALAGLATLDRQDLDATTTAQANLATQTQDAVDVEGTGTASAEAEAATQTQAATDSAATEAADATASAQPTETPEPTETATEEPTATPEVTATSEAPTPTDDNVPDPTPTESGGGAPTPAPGNEVYVANFSDDADDWDLDGGWSINGNTLVSSGNGERAAFAPDDATDDATDDYAVEIVMAITDLNACDGNAGPLGRADDDDDDAPTGYSGVVCRADWNIFALTDDGSNPDVLSNGGIDGQQIDDQPHTYRLEMNGDTIRFFLDGQFLGEATDGRFSDADDAGVYLSGNINVEVTEFRVFALDG